jgi:hypothetical protein
MNLARLTPQPNMQPQRTQRTQRNVTFYLCDLCVLCGEKFAQKNKTFTDSSTDGHGWRKILSGVNPLINRSGRLGLLQRHFILSKAFSMKLWPVLEARMEIPARFWTAGAWFGRVNLAGGHRIFETALNPCWPCVHLWLKDSFPAGSV